MGLESMVAATRADLEARRERRPLADLLEGLGPSDRDFEAALRHQRPAFILEIKPASPSRGLIRAASELDAVIGAYRGFATAVSVLTDPRFFGGSFELLSRVRAGLFQPVLCKGFILDAYQVVEARRAGADAVLLMLSLLDDVQYRAAADLAGRLRMAVLTEVHSGSEMNRATALGARIIGVNNRDLRTLGVDLAVTERLAPLAPAPAIVISESGIGSPADVRRLAPIVDGFLVGSAPMASADPEMTTRALIFGPTKVCGLTSPDDAAAAWELGATHGGLVFAADSPRAVTVAAARPIRAAAGLRWTGVFVNEPASRVAAIANDLGLQAVQLHGDEDTSYAVQLRAKLSPETEIWKAVPVGSVAPPPTDRAFDRRLLDRADPGRRGGTGRTFDWGLLAGLADPDHCILSGGLTPANAAAAAATGISFLDVSSGVERAPGRKDYPTMARFFAARRAASLPRRIR